MQQRQWLTAGDDNLLTMVMGPQVQVAEVESGQWQIHSNWNLKEAKASLGAVAMKLLPLYNAAKAMAVTVPVMADGARDENEDEEAEEAAEADALEDKKEDEP